MNDVSKGNQLTRIKVGQKPAMRLNTSDLIDLGFQVQIWVTNAVAENPIPETSDKVISLRHVPVDTSADVEKYMSLPAHVGSPVLEFIIE